MVRVERPQASRRSSHEPLCRTGRIAGRDRDLRGRRHRADRQGGAGGERARGADRGPERDRLAAGARRAGGLLADGLASRRAAFGRLAGGLHRDAPGQRGHEDDAKQDRPQRRQGAGPDHAHGLVQAGPRQEPSVPAVALAPGRAPHGPERDALDRERGAGGPAGGGLKLGTPSRAAFAGRVRELDRRGCLGEAARRAAACDPGHDAGPARPPDQAGARHRPRGRRSAGG